MLKEAQQFYMNICINIRICIYTVKLTSLAINLSDIGINQICYELSVSDCIGYLPYRVIAKSGLMAYGLMVLWPYGLRFFYCFL